MTAVARNDKETTLELDSNADKYVLGRGALIISNFNGPVNVQGYDPALGSNNYITSSGEIGYLHPVSGENLHLVIHQAIHIPTLDHHLLCPIQFRVAGVTINDRPKFLSPLPQKKPHCIISADKFKARTVLSLALQGVTSILNLFKITEGEWNRGDSPQLFLTDKDLHW